jgi:hypothetical protein
MEPNANHKRIWIWQPSCSPATALICKEINGHIDTRSTSKTTSFPLIISSFRSLKIPQCRRLVYFFFKFPTFFFVLYVFSLFFFILFYFFILFCFSLTLLLLLLLFFFSLSLSLSLSTYVLLCYFNFEFSKSRLISSSVLALFVHCWTKLFLSLFSSIMFSICFLYIILSHQKELL